MALKTAMTLAAGILLAGCASRYTPTPLPGNFPIAKQAKLQAAGHWGAIVDDIEKHVVAELKKSPPRPVFIAELRDASPFQRALATQLTTSLVNDGHSVSRSPAGSLKVDLDVQALTFSADRPQYRAHGQVATLASGIWTVRQSDAPVTLEVSAASGPLDTRDAAGAQFAPGETPRTEIIVTVSVSDQYRYVARNTSAYYVADTDRVMYGIIDPQPQAPQLTRIFKVRGDL